MALAPRIIKRRIRSVANTRKITKAMELVAAAKMRKAVGLAQASRGYTATLQDMKERVRSLVHTHGHPLLTGVNPSLCTLVVVAAADRGLCGGFNVQVIKQALVFLQSRTETLRIITIGKQAERAVRRAGYEIIASFEAISNAPSFERAAPVGELIAEQFLSKSVDRVFVISTLFRGALSQVPSVRQLLPMTPETSLPPRPTEGDEEEEEREEGEEEGTPDVFEPNPDAILEALLPRLLEVDIYQALLESAAAEHSARMLAMRNATENASSMLQELTFTFNQARQASITREISEISAGKAAIE